MFIANETTGVLLDDDGDVETFTLDDRRVLVRHVYATPADLRALADFLEGTTETTETPEAAEARPGLPPGQYLRLAGVPGSADHNGELPCDTVDAYGDVVAAVWPVAEHVHRAGGAAYLRLIGVSESHLGSGHAAVTYLSSYGARTIHVRRRRIIPITVA